MRDFCLEGRVAWRYLPWKQDNFILAAVLGDGRDVSLVYIQCGILDLVLMYTWAIQLVLSA
jgi:hypothetical protein